MEQELRIKIRVDKQTGELSAVGTEFDKLTENTKKADNATKNYTERLKDIVGGVAAIYSIKKAFDGATSSLSALLGTAGEFEKFESVLTTLEGSSKKSQASFSWIKEFAATTPYQLTEVTDAFVKLRSYGINPMDGTLKTLGDTSSAMGKSLIQAVEAIADAVVGENERLKEFGIRASVNGEKIAYSWSDSSGKAKHIVVENNAQIIQSTLNAIFNSKYQDAMQNMMGTWGGLTSNMEDNWTSFKNTVANESGLFVGAKEGLKEFNEQFLEMTKNKELMNALGNTVFSTAEGIASAAIAVSYPIKGISYIVKTVEVAFSQLADQSGYAFEAIKSGAFSAQKGLNSLNPFGSVATEIDLNQKIAKTQLAMLEYEKSFKSKDNEWKEFINNTENSAQVLNKVKDAFSTARSKMLEYQSSTKQTTDEIIKQNNDVTGAVNGTYSSGNNKLINEHKKVLEETQKFNDEQFALLAQNSEKSIRQLDSEIDYKEIEQNAKTALSNMENSYLAYYEAIGDESSAFYLKEEIAMNKLKEIGVLSHSQMLDMRAKNEEKFLNEQFKKNNEWLYDFFENVNKALDEQLLDGMRGKFTSFGAWMKSLFGSIGDSMLAGLSRTFAGGITNTVQSGFVNMYKTYGGLSASSSLVGETLSADDLSKIMSGGGVSVDGGVITTVGGTKIDQATGQVKSQGNDILSLVSTASSLKTAYGMITTGISGSIITGFQSASGLLANMGFGSGASGMMSFGAGVANPFAYAGMAGLPTSMTVGSALSGASLGGIGGYLVGSLGDKIFGADTYAGTTGAIGGALGGLGASLGWWGGPIGIIAGSLLGSVLGGLFGKTKVTGQGIDIFGNATADYADGRYYTSYKKKSWFSSKSWENYTGFNAEELEAIKQTIGAYDYLLAQLGEYNDLVVAGGRFSNLQSFLDTNVVKAFLGSINPQNLDTIYQSWVDYAAQIDKTITEAISTAVGGYTTYKRGYTEWFLGSGTVEQLEFTANYLQKDFEALSTSLGASSVTVDNFLSMYDAAIKENFTQDTIEAWASLGDALMKSTDAAKEYQEALDRLNGSTSYSLPADMLLQTLTVSQNPVDLGELVSVQNSGNKNLSKMVSYLYEIVKSQQELLKVTKHGNNQGIPA